MDWDLLRTFEAVARLGSLTAAARALGVSQSTISRQMSKLEARAGSPLLIRASPVRPTQRGALLLAAIGPMTEAALSAQAALEDTLDLRGEVSVTTVAEVIRWSLVHALPDFYATCPELRLRLLADNHVNSLAAGEADIALRFARPERGDLAVKRLLTESYGLYAAPSLHLDAETPWLCLAGSLAQLPEQRFAERCFADRPPRLAVEGVEALGIAVKSGLGVALLPRGLAGQLDLVELNAEEVGADAPGPTPTRDLWLVVHRSKRELPKIRAVIRWLVETLTTATPALLHGAHPASTSR